MFEWERAGGCPDGESLKAYVDGELWSGERAAVARHLEGCDACAEEVAAMEAIGQELRRLDQAAETPAGLRARILSRIEFLPERRRRLTRLDVVRWASAAAMAG